MRKALVMAALWCAPVLALAGDPQRKLPRSADTP